MYIIHMAKNRIIPITISIVSKTRHALEHYAKTLTSMKHTLTKSYQHAQRHRTHTSSHSSHVELTTALQRRQRNVREK